MHADQRAGLRRLAKEMRAEAQARRVERRREAGPSSDFPTIEREDLEVRATALEKLARDG